MVRAFRRLGHDAQPFGWYYSQPGPGGVGSDRCRKPLSDGTFEPELVVWLECCDTDPQYLQLFDLECSKVYWEFDTTFHDGPLLPLERFERTFMANHIMAEKYGATYLPYGVDVEQFYPSAEASLTVALIGTPFERRAQFCEAAGVDIVSGLVGPDYAAALRDLAVSVHYLDSGGDGMVVARPYETMASGVCLLAEDTSALRRHWHPGVHYTTFRDPAGCRAQVKRLLKNDDEREGIAEMGYRDVMEHHTYDRRAATILDSLT